MLVSSEYRSVQTLRYSAATGCTIVASLPVTILNKVHSTEKVCFFFFFQFQWISVVLHSWTYETDRHEISTKGSMMCVRKFDAPLTQPERLIKMEQGLNKARSDYHSTHHIVRIQILLTGAEPPQHSECCKHSQEMSGVCHLHLWFE